MKKWSGVFPATTTQFTRDERLDVAATQKVVAALIDDGVDGVICMGTVGENCSLSAEEKRTVMAAVREAAGGRVPVLSGVAEYTTALAAAVRARRREGRHRRAHGAAGHGLQVEPPRNPASLPHRGAGHRPAHHGLQQPRFVRRGHHRRHVRRARRPAQHRRHQGILRRHAPAHGPATRAWRSLRPVRRRGRHRAREPDAGRQRLGLGADQCVPARIGRVVRAREGRALRGGAGYLPLVHAAAAPRHHSDAGPVHQARRTAHGARLGDGAGAAPVPRRARSAPGSRAWCAMPSRHGRSCHEPGGESAAGRARARWRWSTSWRWIAHRARAHARSRAALRAARSIR